MSQHIEQRDIPSKSLVRVTVCDGCGKELNARQADLPIPVDDSYNTHDECVDCIRKAKEQVGPPKTTLHKLIEAQKPRPWMVEVPTQMVHPPTFVMGHTGTDLPPDKPQPRSMEEVYQALLFDLLEHIAPDMFEEPDDSETMVRYAKERITKGKNKIKDLEEDRSSLAREHGHLITAFDKTRGIIQQISDTVGGGGAGYSQVLECVKNLAKERDRMKKELATHISTGFCSPETLERGFSMSCARGWNQKSKSLLTQALDAVEALEKKLAQTANEHNDRVQEIAELERVRDALNEKLRDYEGRAGVFYLDEPQMKARIAELEKERDDVRASLKETEYRLNCCSNLDAVEALTKERDELKRVLDEKAGTVLRLVQELGIARATGVKLEAKLIRIGSILQGGAG